MKKKFKWVFILFLIYSCNHSENKLIKTEIYFGMDSVGVPIPDTSWRLFQDNVLNRKLKGYTLIKGEGFWTDSANKTDSENTMILIYFHKNSFEENDLIDQIISDYKSKFRQESVLEINYEIDSKNNTSSF